MRKVGLVLLLVLAVGVAGLATAQAPTGDYASGFGYWQSDTPGSVGFEAIALPLTTVATGEFDHRAANNTGGQGKGFHAEVICLNVTTDERNAFLVMEVTKSTDPAWSGLVEAQAQNNGDGRLDKFGMRKIDADDYDPSDCDNGAEDLKNIRGNIYLAEEGTFARN